ncbi:MAG: hypothetical protein II265_03355 [Clostridia bacterium]|nr:hypothetical protein [Clostridia bacterium]
MKILSFDIETYREHFVCCGILADNDTHEELGRFKTRSGPKFIIDSKNIQDIEDMFAKADYIVSYNGSKFDLPVLAKMKSDVKKMGYTTSKFVAADANEIISSNEFIGNKPFIMQDKEWNKKHFDMLNNCFLGKSLKQWEMYRNLPIRELPYNPDTPLTEEMKDEIDDYCYHDCWALLQLYFWAGSGQNKTKYHTLRARKAIMDSLYPSHLPYKFDRTPQAVAASVIYQSNQAIPPRTNNPLEIFDVDEFDVPQEVKDIIRYLASVHPQTDKEKKEVAERCVYKGIQYGKGGCHYIKKGTFENVYAFDVQSEYPRVIDHWGLLKTPEARKNWKDAMKARFAMKALKGTPEYKPDLDMGYKILVLNALSGGFRIRTGSSPAYDPAAGEAMCYLGQLVISEMAFACPNWEDNVVEINTDSVFVIGENNAVALRKKAEQMLVKYEMLFEEEVFPKCYFRDVNNYIIYDKDGKYIDGRGLDWSDMVNKLHEPAVLDTMIRNLNTPSVSELDIDWSRYKWQDFIYKYHRSAASKFASIGEEPMTRKNYYFMWTKPTCPDAKAINFSRDLLNAHNGSIKTRFGVYAFDIADLEKYKDFIDYRQYHRDLDDNFDLWGREDLITTHLGKGAKRRLKIKCMADVLAQMYPEYTDENEVYKWEPSKSSL